MTTKIMSLDAKALSARSDKGIALIINDNPNDNVVTSGKIFSYLLSVGPIARGKNCEINRFRHRN